MNKLAIVIFGGTALAGCGRKVIDPAHPSVLAWTKAVAINTPIMLTTSWEGTCEFTGLEMAFGAHWGGGSEGNKTTSCHEVDYDATVTCDDNACTSRSRGNGEIEVTPTRAGTLRAHVRFDPRGWGKTKTLDVDPILVVTPSSAAVTCNLWSGGVSQIDFQVYGQTAVLDHTATIRMADGRACTRNEYAYHDSRGEWACPIDALTAQLVVVGPGYTLPVNASCNLVFQPPSLGIQRPDSHYAYDLISPYSSCTDDLLAETKQGFETYGWTTAEATTTKYVATRLGKTATVVLGETVGEDDRKVCTWELSTDAPSLLSEREIPRDPR